MRKYVFGSLAAVSLIALAAPASARDWHHGGHWGGGPSFGVSVGFGGPAYGYADYGYADYGWDNGYYGAYAAAPACTCGSASYGSYPTGGYVYESGSYPSSYGYSYGYAPGYAYGYEQDYYGGGFGVSASFRDDRREFREGRRDYREGRELREERGIRTRTSLRDRGEVNEGVNIRTRSSLRGSANLGERGRLSTTGRGAGENFNATAQGNARGNTQFNSFGEGSGGANGNPNPRRSVTTGQGTDSGALSSGGKLGASGRHSRGMQ